MSRSRRYDDTVFTDFCRLRDGSVGATIGGAAYSGLCQPGMIGKVLVSATAALGRSVEFCWIHRISESSNESCTGDDFIRLKSFNIIISMTRQSHTTSSSPGNLPKGTKPATT